MRPITFVGSLCKIHAVLCSKIADVHGIDFMMFGLGNLIIFGTFSDFYCITPES